MPMKPFVSVSRHLQHEAVPRFASYVRVRRLSVGALNKIGGLYWAKGMKSKPQDKTVRCELCACAHTCCSKTVVEISWNHWVLFWIGLSNFDFKMISASPAPGIPNWRLQDIFLLWQRPCWTWWNVVSFQPGCDEDPEPFGHLIFFISLS